MKTHFNAVRSSGHHLLLVGRHPDRKRFRVFIVDLERRDVLGQWEGRWAECGDTWDYSSQYQVTVSLSWEKGHAKIFHAILGREINTIYDADVAVCALAEGQAVRLASPSRIATFGFDGKCHQTMDLPGDLMHFFSDGSVCLVDQYYQWLDLDNNLVPITPAWPVGIACAAHHSNYLLLGQVAGEVHVFDLSTAKHLFSLAPPDRHHPVHCAIDWHTQRIFIIFGETVHGTTSVLRIFDLSGDLKRETQLDCNPAAVSYSAYLGGFVTGGRVLIRTDDSAERGISESLDFLPLV